MSRFVSLSLGGMVKIPRPEWCPDCDAHPSDLFVHDPEERGVLEVREEPRDAFYRCRYCGTEFPLSIDP